MWRRSPLWMAIKDVLHFKFVNGDATPEGGNLEYKCFMLRFLCAIVEERAKVCFWISQLVLT